MIINRGLSDGSGMGNGLMGLDCLEGNGESLMNSGDSGKCGGGTGGDSGSVPESMVLETCSSFGSINSSVSASNLPPIGVNNEDGGGNLAERKVKVAAPGSIESDNSLASVFTDLKPRIYQDQVLNESESIIYNPSSTIPMQKTVQVPGYPMPHIPDQRHQPVQYIHTGSPHYIQYPTGPVPISSYYPMYVPYQPPPPPNQPYQQPPPPPNQPYPIYMMPVGPTDQSYNVSAPSDINGGVTGSLGRPPLPAHVVNSHVGYKEGTVSIPERAAVAPPTTPSNRVPPSVQPVGPTATAIPTYENDYDNDLAYAQIYKSQPSAPAFPPPKYEKNRSGVVGFLDTDADRDIAFTAIAAAAELS